MHTLCAKDVMKLTYILQSYFMVTNVKGNKHLCTTLERKVILFLLLPLFSVDLKHDDELKLFTASHRSFMVYKHCPATAFS